jgi:tRNA-specific adenosine deaminase 1
LVAFSQAIPFIGFGFMDNAILIIAGDYIDTRLGVVFGISTLCAAAIGNILSDLAGIGLGTVIEDFCANTLKLPAPNISSAQRTLRSVRFASQLGMAVGMTFGCVIGMFPLLFIDSNKIQVLKQKAHLESLFRDVVTEARTLIGAESTCLYLRVERHNNNNNGDPNHDAKQQQQQQQHLPYKPSVDGDYLYAMYYNVKPNVTVVDDRSSRCVPVGKGIVSRAVLTGHAWKVDDVHSEPDFSPDEEEHSVQQMVVVPVLDAQGRAIAVIRATNKKGGFTNQDVQILTSLAGHITVSLQSVYQDQAEDEVRLRDTIRMLKEDGIKGIAAAAESNTSQKSLFPE